MPAKGTSKLSERQRQIIAAGKAAGKPNAVIARQAGLATQTVANNARDPRTTTMILGFKEEYREQFARIFKLSVNGIERDVKAKNRAVAYNARNQALKYITAGDPPLYRVGDQGTQEGDCTLEELMVVLRRVTAHAR